MIDFDDFLRITLADENYVANLNDDTQNYLSAIAEDSSDKNSLGNSIVAISLGITKGLLRDYHEWLMKQLEQ